MTDIDDMWDDDEDMEQFVTPREHAATLPMQRVAKVEEDNAELLAACRAVLFQVAQGPVLARDACISQVRNAVAAATPCPGIEIEPGVWSGCAAIGGDCPSCGK